MNRQQRRKLQKNMGKLNANKISEQMLQFEKLPESCSTCQQSFDKKSKKMVESWSVVVRQEVVRLFCSACIAKVQEVIDES